MRLANKLAVNQDIAEILSCFCNMPENAEESDVPGPSRTGRRELRRGGVRAARPIVERAIVGEGLRQIQLMPNPSQFHGCCTCTRENLECSDSQLCKMSSFAAGTRAIAPATLVARRSVLGVAAAAVRATARSAGRRVRVVRRWPAGRSRWRRSRSDPARSRSLHRDT